MWSQNFSSRAAYSNTRLSIWSDFSRPRYEILTGSCMINLDSKVLPRVEGTKNRRVLCSHLLQRTKPRNEFCRFHFYQIRFHMFDDPVAHRGREKIDYRSMNFRRRGKRPSLLSIERYNFCNLIGELLMNAAVHFCCQLRPLGNGTRPMVSMVRARAVGDRKPPGQIAHFVY